MFCNPWTPELFWKKKDVLFLDEIDHHGSPRPHSSSTTTSPSPCLFPYIFFIMANPPRQGFSCSSQEGFFAPLGSPEYSPPFLLAHQIGAAPIPCPLPLTLPCTTSKNCCYNFPPSPTKIYLIGRERGNGEIAGFILIVSTLGSVL